MSTRGAYGFKCNNQKKIIFSFSDSHFKGLGQTVVDFISTCDTKRLKEKIIKLYPIEKESHLRKPEYWTDAGKVLENIYKGVYTQYFNAVKFIEDDLFCQYYYLIDLDSNTLEIYIHGQMFLLKKYNLDNIPDNWIEECEKLSQDPRYIDYIFILENTIK